jgi:uncharacterized protein YnzC (UPF0291/DUF896 family)
MKPSFVILLISICSVFSCHASVKTNGTIHLTDSNYAVIPYTKADSYLFKNAKADTLTQKEIQEIELLTNKSIDEYNKEVNSKPIKYGAINDIGYKVQLVPVINEKGEKEVWINCFCETDFDWRKRIVGIRDGGSCFFRLKINLSNGKYYEFGINGEG